MSNHFSNSVAFSPYIESEIADPKCDAFDDGNA